MATLGNNLKENKSIIYTKPVFVIIVVLSIVLVLNVIDILKKYNNAYREEEVIKNELKKLEERKLVLEADIQKLDTDKGVEELIRSQYPIAKPGEGVIMIINTTEASVLKKDTRFFSRFSGFFKKE